MKKGILLLMFLGLLFFNVSNSSAQSVDFSDVPDNHWAHKPIMEMAEKGILSGYPDKTFKPSDYVTRAQFAKMLVTSLGVKTVVPDKKSFEDIDENDWSFKYVESAKDYLTGYKKGDLLYFKGNESMIREDIAVALVIALNLENSPYDSKQLYSTFKDAQNISENLKKYVLIAYNNKLISGYEDGTFRPQGKLTRAEASSLLYKVIDSGLTKVALKDNIENKESGNEENSNEEKDGMYVLETFPANNAEGIPVNTDVTIKYSKVIANISPDDLFKYVDIVDSQNGLIGFANLRLEGSVISLQLRNLEPGTKYTVNLPECKDWDRNSCPPYSFSFTTDKKEVNNIFNDGNISFKYPKEFQFEEKVLDTEYSAKYKNVKLDLRYYKYYWPSIEEHLKSVQDDDNLNAPGVYQYSYTKNVLIRTASTNSDTLYTYCSIYTIGMGNKIAEITISADVPLDKLDHEEVEIMVDACQMISDHMEILDPTPCDQTIYGE